MPLTRILKIAILFLFVLAVSVPPVMGQAETATISGRVVDASGAVLVGAAVELRSVERGTVTTLTTNDAGIYVFASVQPGTYQLTVRKTGFRQTDLLGLIVNVQAHIEQNFRLEVGSVSESVTVEGGAPVINLADSALGEVIVGRQVTELPLNGRNFTQLATLVPGVTRGVPTGSATGSGGNAETFRYGQAGGASLAVNGLRPQNNNFTLDGIDNNEALVNTIVFFPPADAIEEFRVQTSVAPAEIGRAGGAVVTTSIKAGTNDWHGTVFWFNRNTSLNARDFFNNGPTPAYNRNQIGATMGGPVLKNKLFVFGDVQLLRLRVPAGNETATVPTDLMRTGDFSELLAGAGPVGNPTGLSAPIAILDPTTGLQFMGNGAQPNVIPANRINAVGLAYLKAFPEPNCNATIDSRCHSIYQNYRNTRNIRENWNDFDVRGDYVLNTQNSLFVRVSRGRADQTNSTRLATLPSGWGSGTNFNHPYGAAIGWTDSIRSTLINEARIGFVRTSYGYTPPGQDQQICTQLGIVNCNTPLLGGIALIGGTSWGNQIEFTGDFGPYLVPQTGYQASDSLSWTRGKHTVKFGGSVIRRQVNLYRPLAGKGIFLLTGNGSGGWLATGHISTGYEVSDLLAGFADAYAHGTNYGMVGTRSWENGFFAQDDWKVTPRLTFNIGLRYDLLTWPVEVLNRQANFDLQTGALLVAGLTGSSRAGAANNYNNFAPRLGFAYQLTGDGKTVVRGGFGMFYFLDRGGINNQLAQNPPFSGMNTYLYANGYRVTLSGALPCQPTCTSSQLDATQATAALPSGNFANLNLNAPTNVSVIAVLPFNATPAVMQWNLQVQRKLGTNSSASLAYVGDHGKNLTRNYNANQQLYGNGGANPVLYPQLGNITVQDNSGKSDYHSLQAQYERRLTNGWQFLGAFTWSKALDDACGNLDSCAPQLYTDYGIERGRSDIDQSYRLVFSSLYELPFGRGKRWGHDWSRPLDWALGGWQMNGIYTLQSGLPFSVTVGGTPGNTRADLVGTPSVNPGNIASYINAAAFAAPPSTAGVYDRPGTAGRNILRGPGSSNLDFALFKNLAFTERFKAQFRAQAYNLSNTPHFGNPNSNFSWGNFGQITGTVPFSYRQVELGLRIIF